MKNRKEFRFFRRFLAQESGSATLEGVLWLPIFLMFFALVADASLLFFGQNRAYQIIQDGNRELSVGRLRSGEEVEAFVFGRLGDMAPGASVNSAVNGGMVTTALSIPAHNLVAIGLFTALADITISVDASQFIEF